MRKKDLTALKYEIYGIPKRDMKIAKNIIILSVIVLIWGNVIIKLAEAYGG